MNGTISVPVQTVVLVVPVIIDDFHFVLSFEYYDIVSDMQGSIRSFCVLNICHYFTNSSRFISSGFSGSLLWRLLLLLLWLRWGSGSLGECDDVALLNVDAVAVVLVEEWDILNGGRLCY